MRRRDSKWSSSCKLKSLMVIPGLFPNGWFEKRPELWPSRISICVSTSISSLTFSERAHGLSVKMSFECLVPKDSCLGPYRANLESHASRYHDVSGLGGLHKSRHIWMNHVTYEWIMSYATLTRRLLCGWFMCILQCVVIWHVIQQISNVTYECHMSYASIWLKGPYADDSCVFSSVQGHRGTNETKRRPASCLTSDVTWLIHLWHDLFIQNLTHLYVAWLVLFSRVIV